MNLPTTFYPQSSLFVCPFLHLATVKGEKVWFLRGEVVWRVKTFITLVVWGHPPPSSDALKSLSIQRTVVTKVTLGSASSCGQLLILAGPSALIRLRCCSTSSSWYVSLVGPDPTGSNLIQSVKVWWSKHNTLNGVFFRPARSAAALQVEIRELLKGQCRFPLMIVYKYT